MQAYFEFLGAWGFKRIISGYRGTIVETREVNVLAVHQSRPFSDAAHFFGTEADGLADGAFVLSQGGVETETWPYTYSNLTFPESAPN